MQLPIAADCSQDIIPLAAVLLEYPVAYILDNTIKGPFLSNIDLQVFACSLWLGDALSSATEGRHTFLQFSYPDSLVEQVGDIAQQLHTRFTRRFTVAGIPHTLEIGSRTERLDRVAL